MIELGDDRSPDRPVGMQLVVDTVTGHHHAFIPAHETGDRIAAILGELGDPPPTQETT